MKPKIISMVTQKFKLIFVGYLFVCFFLFTTYAIAQKTITESVFSNNGTGDVSTAAVAKNKFVLFYKDFGNNGKATVALGSKVDNSVTYESRQAFSKYESVWLSNTVSIDERTVAVLYKTQDNNSQSHCYISIIEVDLNANSISIVYNREISISSKPVNIHELKATVISATEIGIAFWDNDSRELSAKIIEINKSGGQYSFYPRETKVMHKGLINDFSICGLNDSDMDSFSTLLVAYDDFKNSRGIIRSYTLTDDRYAEHGVILSEEIEFADFIYNASLVPLSKEKFAIVYGMRTGSDEKVIACRTGEVVKYQLIYFNEKTVLSDGGISEIKTKNISDKNFVVLYTDDSEKYIYSNFGYQTKNGYAFIPGEKIPIREDIGINSLSLDYFIQKEYFFGVCSNIDGKVYVCQLPDAIDPATLNPKILTHIPVFNPPGKFDYFTNIHDRRYINIPQKNSHLFQGDFTVEFWLKSENIADNRMYKPMFSTMNKDWAGVEIGIYYEVMYMSFGKGGEKPYVELCEDRNQKEIPLKRDKWYHAALSFQDGYEARLYINGRLMVESKMPSLPNEIMEINIGNNPNESSNEYYGHLAEIRIWDKALPDETIEEWANKQLTNEHPDYKNCAAYWKEFNKPVI
jgi:Concanavalin A-like lectin/glucanases superfamily